MLLELQAFCLQPFEYAGLHPGIIAKSWKPADARLFAKPGELALGVAPRGLLNRSPRFLQGTFAAEHRAQFPITDKIEWLRILARAALKQQRSHFAHPSVIKHSVCSGVDALVEFFARRRSRNSSERWGTSARPSSSARKYSPVPTVNTGKRFRFRRSCRICSAIWR